MRRDYDLNHRRPPLAPILAVIVSLPLAAAAARAAAWDAAGAAARAAAWDAARAAARDALKPTVDSLQSSAIALLGEMIDGQVSA